MPKILVSDPVAKAGVDILAKEFPVDSRQKLTPEELIAIIPEYDALVVRSETKVTKEVIAAAKNLKVIGRAGVGVDNIDVEAATQRGIIVLNAPEGNTIAATEHTVAMMLGPGPQRAAGVFLVAKGSVGAVEIHRRGSAGQDTGNTGIWAALAAALPNGRWRWR